MEFDNTDVPSEPRELEQDFMDFVNNVQPEDEPDEELEQAPEVVQDIVEEEVVDDTPDWEALYKAEEQKRKTTEGRFKKAREEWKEKEKEFTTKPVDTHSPDSHKDFWETYEEMREPIVALVSQIVNDKFNTISPKLETLETEVQETSTKAHFSAIAAAHPDYMELGQSPKFIEWMNSLPYKSSKGIDGETAWNWYRTGNASEVIALFNEFKASRKRTPDKPGTPKPDIVAEKVKRAMAAAAVESSGSYVPEEPKANSFEEDFASFLKK